MAPKLLSLLLITLAAVSSASAAVSSTSAAAVSTGVKYGALSDNLPSPSQVAAFLKSRIFIDRVKLFDCNPDFIRAFVSTGIFVAITAPNGAIPSLATPVGASSWIQSNVLPFLPATNITLVFVGNELMATADRNLIAHLVPAMRSIKSALSSASHPQICVSTPSASSLPPSPPSPAASAIVDADGDSGGGDGGEGDEEEREEFGGHYGNDEAARAPSRDISPEILVGT